MGAECEVNGVQLKLCCSVKDLSTLIDTSSKFSNHVQIAVKKAYAVVYRLFRNVHINNARLLVRLYKAYVLPHLEYCSQVRSPYLQKGIARLEQVQQAFTCLFPSMSSSSDN